MGYYIAMESASDELIRPLASLRGWKEAKAFIDTVDVINYEEVVRFAEHAESVDLDRFERELHALLRDDPPKDKTIVSTLVELLRSLRMRPIHSVLAFVTDGMD